MPIGLGAVLLAMTMLPESHGARERLDLLGVALITSAVVAVVWALSRAQQIGWSSPEVVVTLTAGAWLLAAFIAWERRVAAPLVPMHMFAARDFAAGNVTTFLMSGAIFAGGLLVTEEFQLARHDSPVGAGLRLLPFFATSMFVSPIAGALSDRAGRRPIATLGLGMLSAGFAWVAWHGSTRTSWVQIVAALFIAGVGISMALPTVPTAVLSAVAPEEMGKASGINYMAQRFGAVFAVALASTIFAGGAPGARPTAVTAGFEPALWACAGLAGLGALAATTLRRAPAAALTPSATPASPPA